MNVREEKYYQQGFIHGRDEKAGGGNPAFTLGGHLARALDMPEEEAVRLCLADYERRLNALPPLAEYPELKGMHGCVMAYNRGLAEGLNTALDNVLLRANYLTFITDTYRSIGAQRPAQTVNAAPGCTLVFFPRSDRGALVANNQDGNAAAIHHDPPPWIVANRAGVILGTVSSGIFGDEASPQLFPAPVFLMTYELCSDTSETVDLLTRLNFFWGPFNLLIADRHGQSAVIEKSTCRYGLRKSVDGFSATTEMSAEEPAFRSYLWQTRERSLAPRGLDESSVDWAYWKTCERRSARLRDLMDQAKTAPTFEKMQEVIYDHNGSPEQVHMDGSKCHPDQQDPEWSIRTAIWAIDEQAVQYSFAQPPLDSRLTPRQWRRCDYVEHVF